MLIAIELLKGEVSTLAAIDKGIRSYLRGKPEASALPTVPHDLDDSIRRDLRKLLEREAGRGRAQA